MPKVILLLGLLCCLLMVPALAQQYPVSGWQSELVPPSLPAGGELPTLEPPRALPRMAPELALQSYLTRAQHQIGGLESYTDTTIIEANLPSTHQHGRYELRRTFEAPRTLAFRAIRFVGDGFVKSNVIVRLLQSEVDHVQKEESAQTAITEANYKFKFKEAQLLDGRLVYVYEAKARHKRAGLFKGRIYIDAYRGTIRRAEGTMVKSPSFFVKKIEFTQDYGDFNGFSLPVHIHSVSNARVVGRAIVDIQHSDYQFRNISNLEASDRRNGDKGQMQSGN